METYPENYAKQLQHLLAIVNDGKEGYAKAAEQTDSRQLQEIFMGFSAKRAALASELKAYILRMGGNTENTDGGPLGKLHRAWLDLKTALTRLDDRVILETCKNGDQAAVDAYDDVLQGEILNTDLKPMLTSQRAAINQAFLEIDKLYFEQFRSDPGL